MKKIPFLLVLAIFICSLSACSGDIGSAGVDVDLTKLSSTMVYSEVNNIMTNPDKYIGKTIKMSGSFNVYPGAERNYYACLISDATACCQQGIEFMLKDSEKLVYPNDYPEESSHITVIGTFETYLEDDTLYCQLGNATLIKD